LFVFVFIPLEKKTKASEQSKSGIKQGKLKCVYNQQYNSDLIKV